MRANGTLPLKVRNGRRSYMRKSFLLCAVGMATVLFLSELVSAGAGMVSPGATAASSMAADTVPNGTHFLVRLEDELSTGKHKVNRKFEAKTLEPLETSNGYI